MASQQDTEKPWTNPEFKKKMFAWTEEDAKTTSSFTDESNFTVMFPGYREVYLRSNWPKITALMKSHKLGCSLNLVEGTMSVFTTPQTRDPYAIIIARDVIKLLARSIVLEKCRILFDDNSMSRDIINIGSMVKNKERFVKRRQRLLGPSGNNLKAIELLTGCYIFIQGNTVTAVGPYKGLKEVRMIVEDCMMNIHPIYHIKELMIKRELMKDEQLKTENWDRFLPKFNKNINDRMKTIQNRRKKDIQKKIKEKKTKQANAPFFPLPAAQSKLDLQIESGEYFLKNPINEYLSGKKKDTTSQLSSKKNL